MSSVVGNVSIELKVDRTEYDKAVDRLKKEAPSTIMVKTSLDTSGLSKQLDAFKLAGNVRLVASLDTREADRKLTELIKPRSMKVSVDLDTKAFEAKLRNLAIADINVKAKLDTSDLVQSLRKLTAPDIRVGVTIDTASAVNKITEFTKPRSMSIKVDVDDSALTRSFKTPSVKLKAIVDDSALTKLNEHLSLKERHFKQVQSLFSGNPLTPKVDDRALSELNRSIDGAKRGYDRFRGQLRDPVDLNIDTKSVDEAANKLNSFNSELRDVESNVRLSSTIKLDSSGLRATFKYGSDEIERATGGLIKQLSATSRGISFGANRNAGNSISLNPIKIATNLASTVIGGSLTQIGMDFSKQLSSSFMDGLSGGLSSIFGSSSLVGQKVGNAAGGFLSKVLKPVTPFVREHISEEEAATEYAANRGTARKKQQTKIKLAENQVQTEQQFFQENLPQIQQFATRLKGKQGIHDLGRSELDKEVQASIGEKTAADRAEIAKLSKMRDQIIEAPVKAVSRKALPQLNERQSEIKREMKKPANLQQRAALTSEFAANEQAILEINSPEKAKQVKVEQLTRKISQKSERIFNTSQEVKDRYAPDYKQFDVMAKKIEADRAALTKMSIGMNATPMQTEVFGDRSVSKEQTALKSADIAAMKAQYAKMSQTLERFIKANGENIQAKLLQTAKKLQLEASALEGQLSESLVDGKETVESEAIKKQLIVKKAEVQMAKKGAISAPKAARSAATPQIKELEALGQSIQDEEKALSRMRSNAGRPAVENIGVQSAATVAARKKAEVAQFVQEKPKEYVELAKIVMGKDFDEAKLPKLVLNSGQLKDRAKAAYFLNSNMIAVRQKEYEELYSGKALTKETSTTIGEELGHSYDMDFGSQKGKKALAQERIANTAAVPTDAEYRQIAPELGKYGAARREIELSGKTRALRASAEYQNSRGLLSRQTSGSEDLAGISTLESAISGSKEKIKSLADLSNKFGLDLSKSIDILSSHIQNAETKVSSLKEQSLKSIADPTVSSIDRTELGNVAGSLSLVRGGIDKKLAPLQQLEVARSIELPNLQDSKYETSVLSVANKSLKKSGLANSSEAVKKVSAEIKAIESQSKALAQKISKLTPETAAKEYPEISKQAELLAARKAQVSQATAMIRGDVETSSPGVYDRSKVGVDKQLERKEQAIKAAQSVKKGLTAVGGAVFNPDREISIDIDKVKSGVQVTGKALYGGGLAIAKTMDAINTGFSVLAQSNPGQRVLGATKEASTALLHVAKTSYGLAKGVESAALTIVPFGKTAKAGIQNIGLPMLAANVAASHIPGGQMLLEGAGNIANMALGPLAHGGVSAMAQGAGSAIGGVFPQFGGMGAHVASGISGLIEGGLGGAITPAIEGAVTLLSGKLMMNAAGVGAMKLPGVAEIAGVKAIAPSPSSKSLQLPASATKSLPQSTIEVSQAVPQLTDLTDRQLRAYAKTQGLAFGSKAKKDDVVARLEGTTGDNAGMSANIQSQFDRKGRAIGVDVKAESSMLAKLKQKENELNQLHTLARKSQGQKRVEMVSQLLHETDVFTRELNSLNRTPMSGPTAQKVGQTLGRIESKYRHAPENTEAKLNNSETIKASMQGPVYGQTIEAQSQRLYRVADEKQLNIFQKLKNLLSKRSSAVAELNFKALYAEIAVSNKLTDIGNVPALAIGKENSYDPGSNTVSVTKRAYRELSKPIGKLKANEIKPVTHEIQHAQQLDGGNRSIVEAAYGSSEFTPKLESPKFDRKTQRMVDRSVKKAGGSDAVRRLEVDAYAKESQTSALINDLKRKNTLDEFERNFENQSAGVENLGPSNGSIRSRLFGRFRKPKTIAIPKLDTTGIDGTKASTGFDSASSKFDEAERRILEEPEQLRYGWLNKLTGNFGAARIQRRKSVLPKGFKPKTSEDAAALGSDAMAGFNNSAARFEQVGDSINLRYKARLDGEQPKQELNALGRLFGRSMTDPFGEAAKGAKKLGTLLEPIKGKLLALAAPIAIPIALGALAAALPILKQLAGQAIQASIAADRVKTSLEYSTGSKSGASKAYEFADSTANNLGIDRTSAIEGYAKLRASSKGKLSEGQTNELFTGVGAASTTLGLSAESQNGVMEALGQIMSKGTVQAEELRGQIGERLPGSFALAARAIGVTEQQLGKMMETGSLVSDQFIPKFAQQLNREFGGGAEAASQNLQSSLFRIQGAMGRISEGAGAAAAPAMQGFANIAVGGLDLIAKYGEKVSTIFSVLMASALIKVGVAAIGFITPMITQFLTYNGIAATIPGVLGAIGGSLSGLIPLVATFAGKFLLINAGIEIAKTLFAAFTPSDMATRFTSQADKINKSLNEIEVNGKKASGAMPRNDSDAPSKGIDFNAMTFGVAGAVGMGKGDDMGKAVKKTSWLEGALRYVPVIGDSIRTNERKGGKGIATMQEVKFNDDKIALNQGQGDSVNNLAGKYYGERGQFSKSLETAQAEQKTIDAKQAEKSRLLSGGAPNKEAVANIDKQIAESAAKRDGAGKEFSTYRDQIQSTITELKNQKDSISKSADYSDDQKKDLVKSVDSQLNNLEAVKRQLDGLDKQFNSSGDIISKFNVALSEMAAKIEEVSAKAENAFNKAEVSRLTDKKAGRQTDEFASTNNAERQAANEKTMADSKLSGTQKAIADVDKIMQDPTVKSDLAKITVNGKSIDGETSSAELNQAKAGRSEAEKSKIDKLVDRRKAIDSVPGLQKSQLEADEKQKEAKQANVLEKSDRKFKNRDIQFKEFEGKATIGLIQAQKGNKIGESDVAIRSAEIQNISAKEAKSSVKDKITEIDKLYKAGKISKEEFTKRSLDLRGQLVDANVKAAQAELAVEQAKNKKILQDWEITVKKRELADKTTRTEKMVNLAKAQKGNAMSDDDVNVAKSEIDLESANKGSANIATQISELENLKNRGVISHEEYVKRKLDLDSNYLDAKARQADAELALEKAKNQKIVSEFDRTSRLKTFMADELQGNTENEIKRSALSGKVFGLGGEKEAREQRIGASKDKLKLIDEKSRGVDTLRSDGTISQKDYESRKMEATTQYRQENENLLNLEIAKRLGLYQAEADAFKRTTNEVVRGLEKQRSAFEINKGNMSAKQGVLDADLGFAKVQQSSQELKLGLQGENLMDANGNVANMGTEDPLKKKQFSQKVDQLRIDSLTQVQAIEMQILDIKERQQRATLKQAEIESTISIAKQKIAVNEAKKKLKDARLTGDVDAIANAQDDLTGQNQILGLETDKQKALKEQNALAEQRLGIERKTAELGMETERIKVRADKARNQRAAQQSSQGLNGGGKGEVGTGLGLGADGVNRNIDPATGNLIIGGGNFITGEGIQQNKMGGVTPESMGESTKNLDLSSRVDPKKGDRNTVVSYETSNEKSSNKIVNAIDKLGGQLKENGTKSGDKTVSGDYSGIINGLVDSKNSRN